MSSADFDAQRLANRLARPYGTGRLERRVMPFEDKNMSEEYGFRNKHDTNGSAWGDTGKRRRGSVCAAVGAYLSGDGGCAMKTCATCNASNKNTVERVLRCMGCVAKPSGNTNWRPIGHNARINRLAGFSASPG